MEISPLKLWRLSHNPPLSQPQLAQLVGTTTETICRIEKGRRAPGYKTVAKIIRATSISAAALRPDWAELIK